MKLELLPKESMHDLIIRKIDQDTLLMRFNRIRNYTWKQVKHWFRYPMEIVFWVIMPIIWIVPLFFQGKALVGGNESEFFKQYTGTGDYFSFVAIGVILWNIIDSAIWGSGNSLRWEQKSGTFEFLWITPITRAELLIGASLGELIWVSFASTVQFVILTLILGWSFTFLQLMLAIVSILVMLISLFGFSFLFAAIILIFKEPGTLTEITSASLELLTPMRYPLQRLPIWIRWLGYAIPFSWGYITFRTFALTHAIKMGLMQLAILFTMSILMWFIGARIFTSIEHRCRRVGKLGAY